MPSHRWGSTIVIAFYLVHGGLELNKQVPLFSSLRDVKPIELKHNSSAVNNYLLSKCSARIGKPASRQKSYNLYCLTRETAQHLSGIKKDMLINLKNWNDFIKSEEVFVGIGHDKYDLATD